MALPLTFSPIDGLLLDTSLTIFYTAWGQHECLNKGVKLCRKTCKKISLLNDTKFPRILLNLIDKKTREQGVENCIKIDLLEAEQ